LLDREGFDQASLGPTGNSPVHAGGLVILLTTARTRLSKRDPENSWEIIARPLRLETWDA